MAPPRRIVAIIGGGGMGLVSARRLASGRTVFLTSYSQTTLDSAAKSLRDDGHEVEAHMVDIADYDAVHKFAMAAALAGLDLLGTANVIDAFQDVIAPGASMVCISSIARFHASPSPALVRHLAVAPHDQLLTTKDLLDVDAFDPGAAYTTSKCANMLRVQAAARAWAAKGARIYTITPGVILTAMAKKEMESPHGEGLKALLTSAPMQRASSADEIAGVIAFLAGPDVSYITRADIVVDGGLIAGGRGSFEGWS